MKRERGIALLIVLWTLVLLALLATIFGSNVRTEVYLARNLVENAQAEALADAGVYRAIEGLTKEPSEGGFSGDGRVYIWNTSSGEVRFTIRDEGGKIDINHAPEILLREMFVAVGVEPARSTALADAIADFRDEDSEKHPHGAEAPEYEAAGLPYGPKNQPFQLVDELTYVLGMTPELYRKVSPLLTVQGRDEGPHEYTAPPEVLAAMMAAQEASRGFGTDTSGLGTGGSFGMTQRSTWPSGDTSSRGLFNPLRRGGQATVLGAVTDTESARSEMPQERSGVPVFTLHAEGRTRSGAVFAREAVVNFSGSENLPFAFHTWRQGERQLFPLGPPASR